MDFVGNEIVIENIEQISLNDLDCLKMLNYHSCGENSMICDKYNSCDFNVKVSREFIWADTPVKSTDHCTVRRRLITANNEKDTVFSDFCKVEDFYCKLESSIIIWNKDIIHKCPVRRILTNKKFDVVTVVALKLYDLR